jgi:FdhD protein
MTAMMSPVQLEDFVTGYLYTEQIIKNVDEIESIRIEKNRMSVITKNLFKVLGPKKTILSGCGGSTSFIDTEKLPKITSEYRISTADIWNSVKTVLNSELHVRTGGIHIVALLDGEKILTVSEDIGRHNALDRVIGYALRSKIDLTKTWVIVSGRISSEMVRKCLIAGIPIIVSRGATTTLAVETAEKTGLTVVGFARSNKMVVYTHTQRVEGAGMAAEASA